MKNKAFIIYSIIIIIFGIYIILDTFVIEKGEILIGDSGTNSSSSTSDGDVDTTESGSYTSNTYSDSNITITITKIREYDTDIYIADIKVSSIEYLKRAFANNTYGRNIKATTSSIASSNNTILAINGDFYGFRNYGYVLANGTIYRSTSNSNEALVINNDGSFSIVDEDSSNLSDLLASGAYQVFSFGPALINNGAISVTTSDEVDQSMTSNPRTAIGIIDNLHYVFVVSDGRTSESAGLSLYELANVMDDLGCTTAYNLDGGGSTTMYFNGEVVNNPTDGTTSGERKVSDIVYIGY